MPSVGLGTWPMTRELYRVVPMAFLAGYRAFDTSEAYGNEHFLGRSLQFFPRKRIFVTTKLSNSGQRRGNVREELLNSLNKLRLHEVDLYLMHWPVPETFLSSWKQMEVLYKEGFARAIGVCNFHQHHLDRLLGIASVVPAVNQIELHPLLSQEPLVHFCQKRGIAVESYSPLARMDRKLVMNSTILEISTKYDKTAAQIVLRWIVQSGFAACPKSSSYRRLKQNIGIFNFELANEDMLSISRLNCDYRVRHNPDTADFSKL